MAIEEARLFIGIGGHVVAIDRETGEELWRTKLRASNFVTLQTSHGRLYAGAGGTLFRLDPATGHVLWENPLKGLGLGILAFSSSTDLVEEEAQAMAEAATTTG